MSPTLVLPELEPDAHHHPVPDLSAGEHEDGCSRFTRNLGSHLTRMLNLPVTSMAYRSNPTEARPCPQMVSFEITCGPHNIVVIEHDTPEAFGGARRAYTVVLDGEVVPFTPNGYEVLTWQLARVLWLCDLRRAVAAGGRA